ncbi:MAG: hypothetical protein HN700_15940 [Verrucomicrobia bacterium]|nr:hypothetical protein [Verrucomicrobiota bacterium]
MPAMTLATAERTPQIIAVNIGGLCQKENPAMTAVLQVAPQVGLASQYRSQRRIVLQNKIANLAIAIPSRTKLKMLLDLYGKKPSVSLIMLMCLDIATFYSIDIRVSSRSMGTLLLCTAMPDSSCNCAPHYSSGIQVAQFR